MGLAESRECSGVRVKCLEWDELGGKGACLETQPELTTNSSTTVVMTDEEVAMPQSFIASLALFYQQDLKPSLRLRLATFYILNDAFLDGFDLDDSAIPLLALLQSNGSIAALRWFISSYQQKCGSSDEGEGAHLVNTPFDVDVHLSDSTVRVSATPLAFAVALSRGPAVEYFLGPAFVGILDINAKGEDGSTALSIAAILENDAALSLLLSDARTTLETMEAALKSLNVFILHGPSGVSAQQVFSPSRSNGGSTDATAPLSPVSLGNLSASSVLLSAAIAAKAGGSSTSVRVSSLGQGQASGSSSSLALLALAPPHWGSGKASKQTSVKASVVKFAPSAGGAGGGGGGSKKSSNSNSNSNSSSNSSSSSSSSSSSKITRHGEEQQQLDLPLPSRLSLGSLVAERFLGFYGGPTPPPPALAATSLVSSDHTPTLLAPASFAGASSGGGGGVGGTGSADCISFDTPGVSLLFSELPLFATAYSQTTDIIPTPRASTSVLASGSGSGSGSGSSSDADSAAPWIEVQRDNSTTSDDSAFSGSVSGSEVSSSLSTATTATHYTLGGGGGKSSRDAPHSFSSSWYKRMATPAKRVKKSLFRG